MREPDGWVGRRRHILQKEIVRDRVHERQERVAVVERGHVVVVRIASWVAHPFRESARSATVAGFVKSNVLVWYRMIYART